MPTGGVVASLPRVRAELDENVYDAGIKVTDEELAAVAIERDEFHGEWNYRLRPRVRRERPGIARSPR